MNRLTTVLKMGRRMKEECRWVFLIGLICIIAGCKSSYNTQTPVDVADISAVSEERPFVFTVSVQKPNTDVNFVVSEVIKPKDGMNYCDEYDEDEPEGCSYPDEYNVNYTKALFEIRFPCGDLYYYDRFGEDFSKLLSQNVNNEAIIDCGSQGRKLTEGFGCSFENPGEYEIKISGKINHIALCHNQIDAIHPAYKVDRVTQ